MTKFMQWSDSYSVGVKQLDDEHRQLLDLVSQAMETIVSRAPAQRVAGRIDEIASLTRQHFAAEERLMEQTSYRELERHRAEHRSLLEQISKAKENYAHGAISAVDLCTTLAHWLLDHIAQSDKPFAEHFNKSGAEAQASPRR
ncbi:MAG: bacteriohemerythrin [SAR324 cluster bacterium]